MPVAVRLPRPPRHGFLDHLRARLAPEVTLIVEEDGPCDVLVDGLDNKAGLFVATRLPLNLGDAITLAVSLPETARAVELPVVVTGRRLPRGAQRLLASGITLWIAFEALLNVGVMTAVLPFSGVPLPFISYGGSSLVTGLTAVGLLLSISRTRAYRAPRRTRADYTSGRRDRRGRVSRVGRSRGA